jgi:hypothetical protein
MTGELDDSQGYVDFNHHLLQRAWNINEDPERWNVVLRRLQPRAYQELVRWSAARQAREDREARAEEEWSRKEAAQQAEDARIQQERERKRHMDDVARQVGRAIVEPVRSAFDREDLVARMDPDIRRLRVGIDAAVADWQAAALQVMAELDDLVERGAE